MPVFFWSSRRFGFANPQALANGETGTACRGEEHDVTIVWSITSGKRIVLADGKEVHYSTNRNNVFEFSWTMRGNHVLKILAHAAPPMTVEPGFRQYDFFVDGQSFFSFPKVFRLGLAANDPRAARSPRSPPGVAERGRNYTSGAASIRSNGSANLANIEAPKNPDEEDAFLREAIKNSLKDAGRSDASVMSAISAPPPSGNDFLLDFGPPALHPQPPPILITLQLQLRDLLRFHHRPAHHRLTDMPLQPQLIHGVLQLVQDRLPQPLYLTDIPLHLHLIKHLPRLQLHMVLLQQIHLLLHLNSQHWLSRL